MLMVGRLPKFDRFPWGLRRHRGVEKHRQADSCKSCSRSVVDGGEACRVSMNRRESRNLILRLALCFAGRMPLQLCDDHFHALFPYQIPRLKHRIVPIPRDAGLELCSFSPHKLPERCCTTHVAYALATAMTGQPFQSPRARRHRHGKAPNNAPTPW
jgi:hypothetical protein